MNNILKESPTNKADKVIAVNLHTGQIIAVRDLTVASDTLLSVAVTLSEHYKREYRVRFQSDCIIHLINPDTHILEIMIVAIGEEISTVDFERIDINSKKGIISPDDNPKKVQSL